MRSIHRRHRIIPLTALSVCLAFALVTLRPRPAKAELTLATVTAVVALVGAVGEALGEWEWLFEGEGPDITSQLNAVKTAVINELRTQRNQEWRAHVQTVFDNFAILGARAKKDPTNESLRASTLETSKFAFNQYAIIVEDGLDPTSALQLAPMFSVLTVVHAGLTKMKGELNSRFAAPWAEFDIYLKRSIQVSNRLVGTVDSGCWPGYNPGKGNYVVSTADGRLNAGRPGSNYYKSQLWNKLTASYISVSFTNRATLKDACTDQVIVPLPPPLGSVTMDVGICKTSNAGVKCMGNTLGRTSPSCVCDEGLISSTAIPATSACGKQAATAAIVTANNSSTGLFGSNGAVKITRKVMRAILGTGGGDDRWDNSTIPTSGALTDPWVDEPNCGPFGPWAYASTP